MRVIIDADGCPVVRQSVACAKQRGIPAIIVCDCAHYFDIEGAQTITVTKGADSADFRIVNMIASGDIVITQDYGLAAMSLARGAKVMHQSGGLYTEDNIDSMLFARHNAKKILASGGRLKGPSRRTREEDAAFVKALEALLNDSSC